MKKLFALLMLTLLILSACAGGAAPVAEPDTSAPAEESSAAAETAMEDINIVVSMKGPGGGNPFWASVEKGAVDKGAELGVNVSVMAPPSESDVAAQVSQIEDQLAKGVDAIVIAPTDPDALAPVLEQAISEGVPVLFIDTKGNVDGVTFIGTDNLAGAALAAQYICDNVPEGSDVAILSGIVTQSTGQARRDGGRAGLEACGLNVVAEQSGNWDRAEGQSVMENILSSNPNLVAVFASNDNMALGATEALKAAGVLDNILMVGFDANPDAAGSILAGEMSATVAQNPYNMGALGVENAIKLINGETLPEIIDTGTLLVDASNADQYGELTPAAEQEAATTTEGTAGLTEAEGGLLVLSAGGCDYGGKISTITAVDQLTVEFSMCGPDPAFLAKAAFTPFGIQPREYIESTGGTGAILEKPIGTGPYMLESWNRGDSLVYKRFDDYWGDPAIAETFVVRWASEGAARLLELQAGTVDQITNVSPDDFETVRNDASLQLLPVANPNVLYLGMTNTFAPFDNPDVRRAIAMGIDRQRIVDNYYPEGSVVANYFTPCSIPNGCQGEAWYDFDPEAARALLAEAGFPDGFESSIYYRDVFRGYLPEPGLVAVEFQNQLKENLNIDVEVVVMESGEFIAEASDGNLEGFHLLGWGADYPHVTNFLDFHFSGSNPQFGTPHPEIFEILETASRIGDIEEAAPLYEQANNAIRDLVPMVPIAHGASAQAARADITTNAPPFGAVRAEFVDPGKDTFVWMQNAEPIGLWCADQTDGESLSVCQQAVEPLLNYAVDSGDVLPALATSCEPNADSTVWTCFLREGVKFHDGSDFDANDVVASWAAGIDAANPSHVGTTGSFDYFSYLWDGLMNVPQ